MAKQKPLTAEQILKLIQEHAITKEDLRAHAEAELSNTKAMMESTFERWSAATVENMEQAIRTQVPPMLGKTTADAVDYAVFEKPYTINSNINKTTSLAGHISDTRQEVGKIVTQLEAQAQLLQPLQDLKVKHEKRRVAVEYLMGTPPVKLVVYVYMKLPIKWRALIWFLTAFVLVHTLDPDMDSHVGKLFAWGFDLIKNFGK